MTRVQGLGRGKPRETLTGPNLQGKVHLTTQFALGQWDILMGFKPGSHMIGLTFGKNILAKTMRMENDTGAGGHLGNSVREGVR